MRHWGIALYLVSLVMQFTSIVLALYLFSKVRTYKLAYACLILALSLMMFERVDPLIECCVFGAFNTPHVVISSIVSILLLVGTLGIKNIIQLSEKQREKLEKISKTDYLTGVASRLEVHERIEQEFQRSFRTGHPVSLLMIDIDHFKHVNDTYGHPVGDQVLRGLTDICRINLRDIDVMGRVGGEEFLVVLPETDAEGAFDVAERLRLNVAKHVCTKAVGCEIKIQISIGISTFYPQLVSGGNLHQLMKEYVGRSDEAMYQAKQAGRNQTQLWHE